MKKPLLVVISGASGSGKTTLCRMVADKLGFVYGISHTTRSQKKNEKDGIDYFFVNEAEFQKMIDKDEFLEWAHVYGNHYGTSLKVVRDHLNKGQSVILDVDTQGAFSIKNKINQAITIFIAAPSLKELETRLKKRARDSEVEIQKRLTQARHEESQKDTYDYVVVNQNLDKTFKEIKKIIKSMFEDA